MNNESALPSSSLRTMMKNGSDVEKISFSGSTIRRKVGENEQLENMLRVVSTSSHVEFGCTFCSFDGRIERNPETFERNGFWYIERLA
jgi:hypothetical protein